MKVDWKWRQTDATHFFDPAGRAIRIVTRADQLFSTLFGIPVYLVPGWYDDYAMHRHLRLGEDIGRFVVYDAATGKEKE